SQSSAKHGRGDAHSGDDPADGATQRGRRVSAADVCGTGDRTGDSVRGTGSGAKDGAAHPAGVSGAPGTEPRGEGFSGTRRGKHGTGVTRPSRRMAQNDNEITASI